MSTPPTHFPGRPVAPPPAPLRTPDRLALALEIALAYRRVHRLQARHPLSETVVLLRGPGLRRRRRPLPDPVRDGVRLGRATHRALTRLRLDDRCLMRSLVLVSLLAARGASGAVVISARPDDRLGLDAHAWVELDGRALMDPGPDHARLAVL